MIELWIIFALISAFFTGTREIISKKLLNHKNNSINILFIQALISFILIIVIFYKSIDFLAIRLMWDIFLIKSLTLFLFNFFFLKLLEKYDISLISPLNNISPIFLIVMSSVFLNEILKPIQFLGIIIIIGATYFLEINIHHHKSKEPHKIHFNKLKQIDWKTTGIVFLMLFVISICAITDKLILKETNVYTNMFYTIGIMLLAFFIYNIKNKELVKSIEMIKKEPTLVILGIFNVFGTYFILLAIAIPGAMVSLIVPIKRTSTIFSSLFGGMLFHEKHLIKKILSILVMILGIFLISL